MTGRFGKASRTKVLLSVLAIGGFVWVAGELSSGSTLAQQTQSLFMGGNPAREDAGGVTFSKLRFPAGSRSNWHSHENGQLLMAESGRGRTQERGKPVREVVPNQPFWTPAGVEHWHGAAPDQDVLQWTIYGGAVKWLEPVQDKEYRVPPTR
jgi:quercetin dioxygenase-like cupin family protein